MSTVQKEIDDLADKVVTEARKTALACNQGGDTEWLLAEIKGNMRSVMVQIVWAMEKRAGVPLGSTPSLSI